MSILNRIRAEIVDRRMLPSSAKMLYVDEIRKTKKDTSRSKYEWKRQYDHKQETLESHKVRLNRKRHTYFINLEREIFQRFVSPLPLIKGYAGQK